MMAPDPLMDTTGLDLIEQNVDMLALTTLALLTDSAQQVWERAQLEAALHAVVTTRAALGIMAPFRHPGWSAHRILTAMYEDGHKREAAQATELFIAAGEFMARLGAAGLLGQQPTSTHRAEPSGGK